jgi:prevent-host-death family protein
MKEVAVYEAKTRPSELLAEVERGESIVITRRGVAVARLVSPSSAPAAQSPWRRVQSAMRSLAKFRESVSLDTPVREAVAEGRD